eukprot:Platyproteum_vivax@DN4934_c0_g1_i4.p1
MQNKKKQMADRSSQRNSRDTLWTEFDINDIRLNHQLGHKRSPSLVRVNNWTPDDSEEHPILSVSLESIYKRRLARKSLQSDTTKDNESEDDILDSTRGFPQLNSIDENAQYEIKDDDESLVKKEEGLMKVEEMEDFGNFKNGLSRNSVISSRDWDDYGEHSLFNGGRNMVSRSRPRNLCMPMHVISSPYAECFPPPLRVRMRKGRGGRIWVDEVLDRRPLWRGDVALPSDSESSSSQDAFRDGGDGDRLTAELNNSIGEVGETTVIKQEPLPINDPYSERGSIVAHDFP